MLLGNSPRGPTGKRYRRAGTYSEKGIAGSDKGPLGLLPFRAPGREGLQRRDRAQAPWVGPPPRWGDPLGGKQAGGTPKAPIVWPRNATAKPILDRAMNRHEVCEGRKKD